MSPVVRIQAALPALLLAACSSSTTMYDQTPTPHQFVITGAAMSGYFQNIYITQDGAAAGGLTVTVNGTAMTESSTGTYGGHLAAALAAGAQVQVQVTNGTLTGSGTSTVPDTPVITNVTATTMTAPVMVAWTSATSPDSFSVSLNYHLPDNSAAAVIVRLPGTARQATLNTTDILAGGVVFSVGIDGYRKGTFSGNASSTSNMHLRASSASYPLTIP